MYVQKYAFRLKQQLEKTKRRTHNKNLLSQEANSVSNYQDRIGGGRGVRYSSFWCGARPSSSRELLIKEEELEQGLYLDLHDLKATHRVAEPEPLFYLRIYSHDFFQTLDTLSSFHPNTKNKD